MPMKSMEMSVIGGIPETDLFLFLLLEGSFFQMKMIFQPMKMLISRFPKSKVH